MGHFTKSWQKLCRFKILAKMKIFENVVEILYM